jgi:hypothetical protein
MTRLLLALSIATLTAACYGSAPPAAPKIPLPDLSDEAVISVHTEVETKMESVPKEDWTCPANVSQGDPSCVVTRYTAVEPVTRTNTTATYGNEPINVAQFKVLTDPEYDRKVARLDRLRQRCRRANVPRWIGMGLAIGGTAGIIFGQSNKAVAITGTVALGAGITSYAVGYFAYGGRDCNEANRLHASIDYREAMEWPSTWGPENAEEWKVLSEQFNARRERSANVEHLRLSE